MVDTYKHREITVKSAWERLRQRKQRSQVYEKFWIKGLPYKISIFLWRVWFWKLLIDEVLQKMNISIVSRCLCCHVQQETMDHVFLTGPFARRIWNYFSTAAGIMGPFIQIKQTILIWWNFNTVARLKALYQAIPLLVMCQLWKSRNIRRHGGSVSMLRYPWLKNMPKMWPLVVELLENYRNPLTYKQVKWKFPRNGHFKCNTDGASRGNPGPSSAAFFVRNSSGAFLHAMARILQDTTNLANEAMAIEEGTIQYDNFQDIPSQGRRLINMDKSQMPNLSIRLANIQDINNNSNRRS
ncbi:uncharacterized protein LOC132601473 [Lycium barbarum]|uniref:uncharacterized protein LOC132601473 n=1 Tax=Lycium barbarum TaxID=112863 RepID=UPI00293F7353|nr:uncharacterized protein LOC132601473 [Lycium barbarum]